MAKKKEVVDLKPQNITKEELEKLFDVEKMNLQK